MKQLLLACWEEDKKEVIFFSTPQRKNLDEDSSHIAAVDHHVTFPSFRDVPYIFNPISGFLCISDDRISKGRKTTEAESVVCNPSTRQFFTLPKIKTRKWNGMTRYLGYDPVEKQHKVLGMIRLVKSAVEHQVLTLTGDGNMTWRLIECGIPYYDPGPDYICINGVLYYIASVSSYNDTLVCFDVRSAKYSCVNFMEKRMLNATLINFQGKLASVRSSATSFLSGTSASFEMWILEDPEKHEWSKRIFNLPPMWKDAPAKEFLAFVGVTDTNEFVFAHPFPSDVFHVYYYNFAKDVVTRVEIQGMGAFGKVSKVHMFLNHVEDVREAYVDLLGLWNMLALKLLS